MSGVFNKKYYICKMKEIEIWKPVIGFEGYYEVSNSGNVRVLDKTWDCIGKNGQPSKGFQKGKILKLFLGSRGYYRVTLVAVGKKRVYEHIHRLVAKAFIPNPENKREVNHKDGNKLDNRVENLEWTTPQENSQHSILTGLVSHKFNPKYEYKKTTKRKLKRVRVFLEQDSFIDFDSIVDAAKFLEVQPCSVIQCCNDKLKSAGGRKCYYISDFITDSFKKEDLELERQY